MIILGAEQAVEYDPTPHVVAQDVDTAPLSWRYTSWDGTVWELTDRGSSVLKLRGATGVGPSTPEHYWSDAPALEGSSWDGLRVARGSVFLPLLVRGRDSFDFLTKHGAFIRSLDPTQESTLRVTRPDGLWREIACRYESGADIAIELDPVKNARATYGITWATGDPYWSGTPIVLGFDYVDPVPLFPGPPFVINSGRSLSQAKFSNPGDVESYGVWRVNGPFTSFTVGLGASVVSLTLTKPSGGWVEIDMRPRQRTIVDEAGTDQWLAATAANFAPISARAKNVPLSIAVAGGGTDTGVSLTFTPRYRSVWG